MAIYFCAFTWERKPGVEAKHSFLLEGKYSNSDNGHVLAFEECRYQAQSKAGENEIMFSAFNRVGD